MSEIEELLPGRNAKVRSAIVKVASDTRRPLLLKRVIQQLIPIEVKASKATVLHTIVQVEEETTTSEITTENKGELIN